MIRHAIISSNGAYRYRLSRHWGSIDGPRTLFITLNPSIADADIDDPTIRKCMGFARAWGSDGLLVGNLFAYRATDPAAMLKAYDPVGPDNTHHLHRMVEAVETAPLGRVGRVVCAWGAHGGHMGQDAKVLRQLESWGARPYVLRWTAKSRMPEHPLYVPYNTEPVLI